jgi:hypothetical protein
MPVTQPPRDLDQLTMGTAGPERELAPPFDHEQQVVTAFLARAALAGLLDDATRGRLLALLGPPVPPPPPAPARPAAPAAPAVAPASAEPFVPVWERRAAPLVPTDLRLTDPAAAEPIAPPAPREPGPLAVWTTTWTRRLTDLGRAVVSDLALHGFVYLGVLLTFVGMIGFLLFAFRDVPDEAQPVVELAIPAVFFGWAWILRRQRAVRVGQAMELLGGILLPLVIFAALVDGAAFPPDVHGTALIVAMAVVSFTVAGGYQWWSMRHPQSALRYLVAPAGWLAVLALGFAFKADEPLEGEAITRLVSPQPALAAWAVAGTLVAASLRPRNGLARPAAAAGVVGAPMAYLLVVMLAAGEAWARPWTLVAAGLATLVSTEALGRFFERPRALPGLRVCLVAATVVPLHAIWGPGWGGAATAGAFLALFEWQRRTVPSTPSVDVLAGGGAVTGLALSFLDPWAAVMAWASASTWAHVRRLGGAGEERSAQQAVAVGAAVLPLGLLWALGDAIGPDAGLAVFGLTLLAASVGLRLRRHDDEFWRTWSVGAAVVITALTAASWANAGVDVSTGRLAVAAAATTGVLAVGARRDATRIWGSGLSAVLTLALAVDAAGVPASSVPLVWAGVGLGVVAVSLSWPVGLSGHVGAVGHLIGLGAVLAASTPLVTAACLTAWTGGWLVAVVGDELRRGSVGGLLAASVLRSSGPVEARIAGLARLLPAVSLVVTTPLAVLAWLAPWETFAARPSLQGVALGATSLVGAAVSRLLPGRRPLVAVVGVGTALTAVVAVVLALPERGPTMVAAAAAIAVALVLLPEVRPRPFDWFAWSSSGLLVVLIAEQAGVADRHLGPVLLGWASVLLIGGLHLDDRRSGRRTPGEGVRSRWLLDVSVVGSVGVVVALATTAASGAGALGWWSLAGAAVALVAALQLRVGAASTPAYVLAVVAASLLSPWPPLQNPWTSVFAAAVLVGAAWLLSRLGPEPTAELWLRWDLPPLVLAHLVVLVGFASAEVVGGPLTWASLGVLSFAVSTWRRQRLYADAGNAALLVGAALAGPGWATGAWFATAGRGVVVALRTSGWQRGAYQLLTVVAVAATWIELTSWQQWAPSTEVSVAAVAFGTMAVIVAAALRFTPMPWDLGLLGGGIAAVGSAGAAFFAVDHLEGVLPALGMALFATGVALAVRPLRAGGLVPLALAATAVAWIELALGVGWGLERSVLLTAPAAGALGWLAVEVARFRARRAGPTALPELTRVMVRGWTGLAVLGVVVAGGLAAVATDRRAVWFAVAAGTALLAAAAARGSDVLAVPRSRETAALASLASLTMAAYAAEATSEVVVAGALVLGLAATVAALLVWRSGRDESAWVGPLAALGVAAGLEAAVVAGVTWPRRDLLAVALLALGGQAAAAGLTTRRAGLLRLAPALVLAAWLVMAAESLAGNAQWYTAPVALTLLAEVEIARWHRRRSRSVSSTRELLVLEWAGIAVLAGVPLTYLFTRGLGSALVATGLAIGLFVWGLITQVRRRVVAAAALATGTAVLTIAAAVAGQAPASAAFWILVVGIGFAVMLVVAVVEGYRSRTGRVVQRFDQLAQGWE